MSRRSGTIINGIFIVISSILVAWLVPFNLKEHLAIQVPGDNLSTEWLDKVNDEEYDKLK